MQVEKIPSLLLKVSEAAAYLNTSTKQIRSLVHTAQIPYIKLGKTWRVRRSDLDAWVAKNLRTEGARRAA